MTKDSKKKKAIRAIMAELGVNYRAAATINEERRRNANQHTGNEYHEPDQRSTE